MPRRVFRRFRPGFLSQLTAAGRANWKFASQHGPRVSGGPFAGMVYPPTAKGHVGFLGAKLLGSYECELGDALERVIPRDVPQVVDVGSGEGYYLVGLAMRMAPSVALLGYELDPGQRALCEAMAELNGVGARIRLDGRCDPDGLNVSLQPGAFLICDCEGYEYELLRPDLVPNLRSATILVELHPHVHADIWDALTARFNATHAITRIPMQWREPSHWNELQAYPRRDAELIVSEGWLTMEQWRMSGREWAFMEPSA